MERLNSKYQLRELATYLAWGLAITLTLALLNFQILRVSSFSMEPTLTLNDVVIVENITPLLGFLMRGEVIVYRDPRDKQHPDVVKRIVGLPNERLFIMNDIISVVDKHGATTTFEQDSFLGRRDNGKDFSIILGPEDYFLMGDNRPGSKDSRVSGTIQPSEMIGHPILRILPLSRFGFVK